MQQIIRSGEI